MTMKFYPCYEHDYNVVNKGCWVLSLIRSTCDWLVDENTLPFMSFVEYQLDYGSIIRYPLDKINKIELKKIKC